MAAFDLTTSMYIPSTTLFRLQGLLSAFSGSMTSTESQRFLFGGTSPWVTSLTNWTAVDDRVRGGSSQSYFSPITNTTNVRFSGTLDTKTLGGAGFASQTTTGSNIWDLSSYEGLIVDVLKGDGKVYTIIVKDEVPDSKRDDGREQSSVSWEYDFETPMTGMELKDGLKVRIPWNAFKATYRGREKKDAAPLKTKEIKRFSLMMRSFFEKQDGEFDIVLASISAVRTEIAVTHR